MAPLGGKPGIVKIEPADHRANVKGCLYRIELKLGARHACAVGHHRAWHDWPKQFFTGRVFQRFQTTAERVEQAVMRGVVRHL